MLQWAVIFGVVALVAGGVGFTGMAGAANPAAKLLFALALGGFVLFLALALAAGRRMPGR